MSFGDGWKTIAFLAMLGLGSSVSAQQIGDRPLPFDVDALEEEVEYIPDPARGERLFQACRKCHETAPGVVKIGPSLAGVVGRRPGSVPDFGYSRDMIDLGGTGVVWNEENLDQFLTRPRAMIGGTKMVFQGFRKPNDRADLIAFLLTVR